MADAALTSDHFAKLVNKMITSRMRARIIKRGRQYICQDDRRNELAEIIVRPTYNDVLVRFMPSASAPQRPGESFPYEVGSTAPVARAIIDWVYKKNRVAFEKMVGLKN